MASTSLPADFRNIPASSPAAVVLVAVAGMLQAQEAVIENSIPQTATIQRVHGPTFSPVFDGSPQFLPISGTPLQYVVNSPTPIIGVDATTYYALRAGVWFTATSLSGPWIVAASVPQAIYTISCQFACLSRDLRQGVWRHPPMWSMSAIRPGIWDGGRSGRGGRVRHGVCLPAVGRQHVVRPASDLRGKAQPVYNPAVGWAYGFGQPHDRRAGRLVGSGALLHAGVLWLSLLWLGQCQRVRALGHAAYSGTRSWYATPGGTVGTTASGAYTSERTGTTGSYQAGRSYNPYTGQARQGYDRTFYARWHLRQRGTWGKLQHLYGAALVWLQYISHWPWR